MHVSHGSRLQIVQWMGRGARLALTVTLNWLRTTRAVQRVRLHQHPLPVRFFPSVRPSDGILWRKARQDVILSVTPYGPFGLVQRD